MSNAPHPSSLFRLLIVWLILGSLLGPVPQVGATPSWRAPNTKKAAPTSPALQLTKPALATSEPLTPTTIATTLPPICRNPNAAINSGALVVDQLNVGASGQLASLDLILTGTHSYVGDLTFTLTHQTSGIQSVVIERPGAPASTFGCANDNFGVTLDDDGANGLVENQCNSSSPALFGRPRPNEPLALFTGVSLNGLWSLTVRDSATSDSGMLQSWCIVPTIITPALTLSSRSLSQTQPVNTIQTRTLNITNTSGSAIAAQIGEGLPGTPLSLLLHNNGPLVNSPGSGAGGADQSLVQTGLGLSDRGADFRQDGTSDFSLADDFVVTAPGGWRVNQMLFWGYEIDSGLTPTITGFYYRFWNRAPNAGGSAIFGDMSTNRAGPITFSNIYRARDTESGNTQRPVMRIVANGSTTYTLPGGLRWLEWSANGSSGLEGPYAPYITINGLAVTGNALGRNGITWGNVQDGGSANAPQGFPFQIYGYPVSPRCTSPTDMPWLTLAGQTSSTITAGNNVVLNVAFDTNGLTQPVYTGTLCILNTDSARQLLEVPVTLTVQQPTAALSPAGFTTVQKPNTISTQNLQISNAGSGTLTWNLGEAYGTSAGEAAVGDSSFTYITDRANADGHVPPEGALPPFAPVAPLAASLWLHEDFTSVASLPSKGWVTINRSNPVGPLGWAQGNATTFPSHSGVANSYVAASFDSTTGNNTISNWLLSPELVLRNGSVLTFYTRVPTPVSYADRLEVRLSMSGAVTDVGATANDVGVFTHVLQTINPNLTTSGYPITWTAYTIVLTNVTPLTTTGRIAFRYFVENGGPQGTNSNYIGIDTLRYTPVSDCTDPVDMPWLSLSATSGNATNGSPSNVTLTFNTAGLFWGRYTGNLCLTTNDPVTTSITEIPIVLNVLPYQVFLPLARK